MKTDPKLTSGMNVYWIKFFLTAVYATMYVRDHQRPAFHAALGVDPDWYAHEVFTKTSKISKQIFPITLDIEHPRWQKNLERLHRANVGSRRRRKTGGVSGKLGQLAGRPRRPRLRVALHDPGEQAPKAPGGARQLMPGWSPPTDAALALDRRAVRAVSSGGFPPGRSCGW
jgi:magnesium-protoporphyrin IX monomethyl ester (oxidative) cyclase